MVNEEIKLYRELHPEIYDKCKCGRVKQKSSTRCSECFRKWNHRQLSRTARRRKNDFKHQ